PRHDGLSHAQHRPHRQRGRDLHRLLRPAVLHRRPRRLYHRPEPDAHRTIESRPAGSQGGAIGEGPDDCRPTQAAGLRDGTVRQEPPRRPQRVPAQGLPDTKVGAFTPALYDEAKRNGWTVISMKNDWRRIFAFEP